MNFRLMRQFFYVFLSFIHFSVTAQVSNNNITDRAELLLNAEPIHSNTNNSSVEWNCISKALTNKCLIYHNDQWFHFTPNQNGRFFLNVSSQQCRDERGIQVIVIEGNPCEVKTYKILQCIPKVHQDDIFIELDSLKYGTQYLVNIDGFLGDFCNFDIQFSRTPKGTPRIAVNLDSLNMKAALKGHVVTIGWSIHDALTDEINSFKIFRLGRGEQKSVLIKDLPLRANALGDYNHAYSVLDSLSVSNRYRYRIFGIQKDTEYPLLLDEQEVSFYDQSKPYSKASTWVSIPLALKSGSSYQVLVLNRIDYSLLRKYSGAFDELKDATFEINLDEFVKTGVKEFIVLASEPNSSQPKEFYFIFDGKKLVGK
jgi:hypothetical protein